MGYLKIKNANIFYIFPYIIILLDFLNFFYSCRYRKLLYSPADNTVLLNVSPRFKSQLNASTPMESQKVIRFSEIFHKLSTVYLHQQTFIRITVDLQENETAAKAFEYTCIQDR